ncbi:MAG: molecular chaperone Tir [Burkholderiaceae bacterium]|nr:molecular chaperone Tir [Burkholderiaceae bacterium]
MPDTRLNDLLQDFCSEVGLHPPEILRRRKVLVKGIDVGFSELLEDPDHFYLAFQFGAIAAGRTLKAWRLMLEANVLVYAKDVAVMGMDPDTGGVVLTLRGAYGPQASGRWLADTLAHFAEHGVYWQNNILDCPDEMFNGISSGLYQWIKA